MRRSSGLTRTIASLPSFTKNKWDRACATFFPAKDGNWDSLMSSGTTSPIDSGAFAGAFGTAISFTFSGSPVCRWEYAGTLSHRRLTEGAVGDVFHYDL